MKAIILALIFLTGCKYPIPETSEFSREVIQGGNQEVGINLVFLAEGFSGTEMGAYKQAVSEFVEYMFNYNNMLKMHKKSWIITRVDNYSDGYQFDTKIGCNGLDRLICMTNSKVRDVAGPHDTILVLVNSNVYAGGAVSGIARVALSPGWKAMLVHELGHSFADLDDEYNIEQRDGEVTFMRKLGSPFGANHLELWSLKTYEILGVYYNLSPSQGMVNQQIREDFCISFDLTIPLSQGTRFVVDGIELIEYKDKRNICMPAQSLDKYELVIEIYDKPGSINQDNKGASFGQIKYQITVND